MPPVTDDEVLDFQIVEAVQQRMDAMRKEEQDKQESKQRRRTAVDELKGRG